MEDIQGRNRLLRRLLNKQVSRTTNSKSRIFNGVSIDVAVEGETLTLSARTREGKGTDTDLEAIGKLLSVELPDDYAFTGGILSRAKDCQQYRAKLGYQETILRMADDGVRLEVKYSVRQEFFGLSKENMRLAFRKYVLAPLIEGIQRRRPFTGPSNLHYENLS